MEESIVRAADLVYCRLAAECDVMKDEISWLARPRETINLSASDRCGASLLFHLVWGLWKLINVQTPVYNSKNTKTIPHFRYNDANLTS